MLNKAAGSGRFYLVCKLGHVVLQAALVVRLLTHLNQDVEVAVLLSQRSHPLVLTQLHCNTQNTALDWTRPSTAEQRLIEQRCMREHFQILELAGRIKTHQDSRD